MARIDDIFKSETKKAEQHPKRITKWIHYTKLHDNDAQYCNERNKEEIEALADLIEADGEVLQDLLVKKTDTDEYTIIAGHKRRRACKLLVEERGREEFALVPCVIKNLSDIRAEFQVYSSNGYHDKTEYEKMHELERMKYLLENYPEEFPQAGSGRMVERLAKLLNMNKTTVGEYLTISANLGKAGMKKFESGEMKKSAAVAMSSLPTETQDELIKQGIITHKEIRSFKKSEVSVSTEEPSVVLEETVQEAEKEEKKEGKLDIRDGAKGYEQPKLPQFKNNDQRKEWLRNYKTWGIWYVDSNIGCTYYKYDFDNGAKLIVETYVRSDTEWHHEIEQYYFHLVGGPEPPKGESGIAKWNKHEVYTRHTNNETELIEFLKYIQSR